MDSSIHGNERQRLRFPPLVHRGRRFFLGLVGIVYVRRTTQACSASRSTIQRVCAVHEFDVQCVGLPITFRSRPRTDTESKKSVRSGVLSYGKWQTPDSLPTEPRDSSESIVSRCAGSLSVME